MFRRSSCHSDCLHVRSHHVGNQTDLRVAPQLICAHASFLLTVAQGLDSHVASAARFGSRAGGRRATRSPCSHPVGTGSGLSGEGWRIAGSWVPRRRVRVPRLLLSRRLRCGSSSRPLAGSAHLLDDGIVSLRHISNKGELIYDNVARYSNASRL